MTSLFEKLRVGFLAQAHSLVDRVIDMNSAEVVKQYVRELEGAIQELEDAVADDVGSQRGLQRELEGTAGEIKQLDKLIDEILTDANPANDKFAVAWQIELNQLKANMKATEEEFKANETAVSAVKQTIETLEARKDEMIAQIERLAAAERIAKAKERAADTVTAATRIAGQVGEGASVDNLVRRAEQRADVADARLEEAMGNLQTSVSSENDKATVMAELALAERRRRLEQKRLESSTTDAADNAAADRLQA